MLDFLQNNLMVIVVVLVVAVFLIRFVMIAVRAGKTKREGTETDAAVLRVRRDVDTRDGSVSYLTDVQYRDEDGVLRESFAGFTQRPEYEPGQTVRIRFLPGHYDMAWIVKDQKMG